MNQLLFIHSHHHGGFSSGGGMSVSTATIGLCVITIASIYLTYLLYVMVEFTIGSYDTKRQLMLDIFIPFRGWILPLISKFKHLK